MAWFGGEAGSIGDEIDVEIVAHGRPATLALARRLTEAKAAGHPLDPVTVVVPSNTAGLSARRLLAVGDPADGGLAPVNLANVGFVTPFRLAELFGSGALEGRRPLTNPVLAAAVRASLAVAPGMFEAVAGHQATSAAVASVYAELSRALPQTRSAIAVSGRRGAEVVRVVDDVRARLAGFYDEDDLAAAAAARVDASRLGTLVWYLPDRLSPAMAALLTAALTTASASAVLVGVTGDPVADGAVLDTVRACGVDVPLPSVDVPVATQLVSVSDADEEVRYVVREVVRLVTEGTPLDRIAIFRPSPGSYDRTLSEQLDGAGIPHNGPAAKRLADTVAGRTLLAALRLPGEGWGRNALIALVSGAPVRADGRLASPRAWDALSRRAGVVGGLDDWHTKLGAKAASLAATIADAEGDDSPSANSRRVGAERELETVGQMQTFVEQASTGLVRVDADPSWGGRSEAARELLVTLLGPESRRVGWPDVEVAAAQRVDEALVRLGALDDLDPAPSRSAFELAVAAELDATVGRVGGFGHGVLVSPLASAAGFDFDAVFVLGLAEGTCPAFRRDSALLPDADRALAVAGELVTSDDRLATQRRAFLAALASGGGSRVLLFPRGDLRGRRDGLPSRWFLESASARRGKQVLSSQMATLSDDILHVVPSFARGVADAPVHGSLAERDVAELFASPDPAVHPLVTGDLARGFEARSARAGASFTEWDGNLEGHAVESPAAGVAMSPSRLETWAACPFKYFLSHVLRLGARDDPERIVEISPAERGTLVHLVLERFLGEVLARPGGAPAPDERWTVADRQRVVAIAGEEFLSVEGKGLSGRPLMWRRTQAEVLADLDEFLTRDDRHRAEGRLRPARVELAFGLNGAEPVAIELPSGRTLTFRGKVDRVDEGHDGRHVVLDYKTGSGWGYDELSKDPVRAGRTLQLGVYAEAARSQLGADVVDASYWMISPKGKWQQHGYEWTDDRRRRFLEVAEAIVDGIESGLFPALPGEYDAFWGSHDNCRSCDFDRICPRDREDHQEATAEAAELTLLERLQLRTEATS